MKRFVLILLLASTSPAFAQEADRAERNTLGDAKPLSQTVKEDEQQPAAFELKTAKPAVEPAAGAPASVRAGLKDLEPQSNRH